MRRSSLFTCLTLVLGCAGEASSPQPPPKSPPPAATMASAPPPPIVEAAPEPPLPVEGVACGELGCRHFPSVEAAMAVVLETNPAVLAVGEAHAQRGNEGIDSSTKRFTETFLPMLKGKATDVVIELTAGQSKCQTAVKETEKATKPVTENQAQSNQSEFMALGTRAKALEIRPHVLRPTCPEFDRVAKAETLDDKVVEMLTMIARNSDRLLRQILARNGKMGRDEALVLAYGGALHNDLKPDAGKEAWSFGPSMSQATEDRFVELDIFVPEYIKDTPSWKAMAWHRHYDRASTPEGAVTLFRPHEHSFVLIFAPQAGS